MKSIQKSIWIFTVATMVTMVGCKSLQETAESREVTQPEAVTLMTETELRETLVGNTFEGDSVKHPGSTYIEFIQPDGTIRGLWDGKDRYKGEWVISGQVWCYKYKSSNGCSTMAKTGNTISWYALDDTTRGGKSIVMAGDPKNHLDMPTNTIRLTRVSPRKVLGLRAPLDHR
jgi:hypothetical protein